MKSIPEAVEAVNKIKSLDRATVWHVFESQFSANRMAQDYIRIYQKQGETHAVPRATGW